MGRSKKKKKHDRKKTTESSDKEYVQEKRKPPNQEILDSIGSPNAWTPEREDAWIEELRGISAGEIYRRFPPIKKPGNVGRRGKSTSWGGNDA